MTDSHWEMATLHSAGDCLAFCVHPDHDYDGDPIDLGLFLSTLVRERARDEDDLEV